jgi:hypothetical protein
VKIRNGRKMIIIIRRQVIRELTALQPDKRLKIKLYKGLNSTNRINAIKIAVKNGFMRSRNAARIKIAKAAKKYLEKGALSPPECCGLPVVLLNASAEEPLTGEGVMLSFFIAKDIGLFNESLIAAVIVHSFLQIIYKTQICQPDKSLDSKYRDRRCRGDRSVAPT